MKLNKTYIGRWLSLVRIQSTPVTVITLCLGYITVSQRLNLYEMIPLVVVGCLGHWGFYAQNDVMDYEYDIDHKSIDKPLVSKVISRFQAQVVSSLLIITSVFIAVISFSLTTSGWFILSAIAGLTYNFYSKKTSFSGLYLSVWGISIVMTGATYAGKPNISVYALAYGVGIHMLVMTMMGDIKDIDADEPSIPRLLGVWYTKENSNIWITSPKTMIVGWTVLDIAEALSIIMIIIGSGIEPKPSLIYVVPVLILLLGKSKTGNSVFSSRFLDDNDIKKDIVSYELICVTAYIVAISTMVKLIVTAVLIIASVGWGLLWQKIMYGKMFYFP